MLQRTFFSFVTGALVCMPVLAFAQAGTVQADVVQASANVGIVPPAATQAPASESIVETKGSEKAAESQMKAQGDAHKAEQGKTEDEKCKNLSDAEKAAMSCPASKDKVEKDMSEKTHEKVKAPKAHR